MTRTLRKAHFLMWLVLGPAIAIILILALQARPAPTRVDAAPRNPSSPSTSPGGTP
jgi:hypothetical protein